MIKALKALSALLTYPSAELQQAAGEISEAIENEPAIDHCRARSIAPAADANSPATIFTICRSATCCCSTIRGRCRCICSSTCTARAATAARP